MTTHTATIFNVWDVVDWSVTLRNPGRIDIAGEAYDRKREQVITWSGVEGGTNPANDAHVWDTETGKLLFTLETPAPVYNALWSPDGKNIVVAQQGGDCAECFDGVIVFDARTGRETTRYDAVSGAGFLSWIPDTSQLISDQNDQLTVLDIDSGEVVFSSDVYVPGLSEWNSDYTMFVDQNTMDYTTQIVNFPEGEVMLSMELANVYYDVDWVADDRLLVLLMDSAIERTTDLVAYDITTGDEAYRIENVGIFEESPSADHLLVYTEDQQLHHVQAETGEVIWSQPTLNEDWTDILWSPDETKAVLTGFLAGRAQVFDVTQGTVLTNLNFSQYQWSPDSRLLLVYDDNLTPPVYRVYDVPADQIRFSFSTGSTTDSLFRQFTPMWTPDGREIVSHEGVWVTNFAELINRGEDWRVRTLTPNELEEFFIKPPPDKPVVLTDDETTSG